MFILVYFLQAVAIPVAPDAALQKPEVVSEPIKSLKKKAEQQGALPNIPQNGENKQAVNVGTESKTRIVIFKTNISKEMTSYKHGPATYTPEFTLKVDDITVPLASSVELCLKNNECLLSYEAKFPYSYASSDKRVVKIAETTKELEVSFDWSKDPRILVTEK